VNRPRRVVLVSTVPAAIAGICRALPSRGPNPIGAEIDWALWVPETEPV
jgi:hypothetical protein